MTKNYSKETIDFQDPEQSTIDFILNYSKALHINLKGKVEIVTILN